MSAKIHCDGCDKVLTSATIRDYARSPKLYLDGPGLTPERLVAEAQRDFCGWPCVAKWATEKANTKPHE